MSVSANRRPAGPPASASRARRTRVLVIVGLFIAAVFASAFIGWRFARESVPVAGPIVLITIDALPAAGLSFYGGAAAAPHLDRLAARAMVFEQAFAHAPATLPAHASLLTGQLPFEHGVRDDVGFAVKDNAPTLAARLADRGFDTGAAVSTVLLRRDTGLDTGFGAYDADLPEGEPEAFVPPATRPGADTARAALAWLDRQGSERFFYAMHLGADTGLSEADAAVGLVLDLLQRKGWYDEALVIVTSVYGGAGDDPGRGYTLAEPALRVPLLIKMPGATRPRRFATPVQHIDVVPTLLDLVRAPGAGALRGRSLRAVLEDDATTLPAQTVYAEAMTGALRHGWAELSEPGPPAFAAAVTALPPTLAPAMLPEAIRHRLALAGSVAPTLPPVLAAGPDAKLDPRAMRLVVASYERAARHDAARAFGEAILEYRTIVQAVPTDADAWRRLGVAARRLGRQDEAEQAFARVTELRPELGVGALESARLAFRAGQLGPAQELATTAAATPAPAAAVTRAEAHDLLAAIALALKNVDEARAQAALAEKDAPGWPFVAFLEGRQLHDQEQYEEALARFDAAAKADLTAASATAVQARGDGLHWYRGEALAKLNRPAEAMTAFEAAIADAPLDVRAYTSLAAVQRAADRRADAAATAERLVRAVPTPAGYAAAVRVWTLLGDRTRANAVRVAARGTFKGEPGLRLLTR